MVLSRWVAVATLDHTSRGSLQFRERGLLCTSVGDPDLDLVRSGLLGHTDPDPDPNCVC